jgi:hypothetical protein
LDWAPFGSAVVTGNFAGSELARIEFRSDRAPEILESFSIVVVRNVTFGFDEVLGFDHKFQLANGCFAGGVREAETVDREQAVFGENLVDFGYQFGLD